MLMNPQQEKALPANQSLLPAGKTAVVCLGLVVVTFALFLNGLNAPFTFDDISNIQANPEIRQLWPLDPLLNESRMVGYYSFALNYACGAREAWMHRLTNILIHAVAGCFMYLVVRRALVLARWTSVVSVDLLAATIACLWLIHPLQTGSVTYVVQRLESLMGLCFLVALYCLLRGALASRKWGWYGVAILACWLGLFTKEVMATFLPVALLFDRAFLATSWPEVLRKRGWLYVGCLLGVAALIWVTTFTYAADANTTAGFHSQKLTPWMYLRTQPEVILHYLRLVFFPVGQSIDYGWPVQNSPLMIYGCGSVILALLIVSLYCCFTKPQIGCVALVFFLILAPTSSFLPIDDLAFEHRMYLPLACVLILTVLACTKLLERCMMSRTAEVSFISMMCLAAGCLGTATVLRNAAYMNNLALWQAAVNVNPQHARTWNNLAGAYRTLKKFESAQECFEKALLLKPDDKYALTQLPLVLATLSKQEFQATKEKEEEAIGLAERLIMLFPDQPRHRISLIKLLEKLGRNERAEQECTRLIADLQPAGALAKKTQKRPRWDTPMLEGSPLAETHFHWALLLMKRQAWQESYPHLQQAEALACRDATVYFQQGVVLAEMRQTTEAMEKYRQAIQCELSHEASWNNLAMLLARAGETQEAGRCYRQALYWKPDYPEALDNYGNLFARAQQYRAAIALYEKALKVDAEYQPALKHLAAARRRLDND